MSINPKQWHFDIINGGEIHGHKLTEIFVEKNTKFQKTILAQTANYGRALILDNRIQAASVDEYVYHESLVHPALVMHGAPKSVAVIGGGEGATIREVLRHKTIEKVHMIDIDGEVVDFCKKYLQEMHQGAFDNSKVKVIIDDARDYMEKTKEKYDVIIVDLSEPAMGGPSYKLFTKEFYDILASRLTEHGIMVVQSCSAAVTDMLNHTLITSTVKASFKKVWNYVTFCAVYGADWGFCLAVNSDKYKNIPSPEEIDKYISKDISGSLKLYDGETHKRIFSLPKYLREAIKTEDRVCYDKNPPSLRKQY